MCRKRTITFRPLSDGGGEFEFSPIVFDMRQYVDVKSSVKSVPAIKIRKLSRNHFGFLCFFSSSTFCINRATS